MALYKSAFNFNFNSATTVQKKILYSKNLNSLELSHLHVYFASTFLISGLEIFERFLAFFRRLLVVLQSNGELIPQIFDDRLEMNTERVFVLQVLVI